MIANVAMGILILGGLGIVINLTIIGVVFGLALFGFFRVQKPPVDEWGSW